jgi:hypothetical protein
MLTIKKITVALLYSLALMKGIFYEIITRIKIQQLILKYRGYDNIPLSKLSLLEMTYYSSSRKHKELNDFLEDVVELCELLELHFEESKYCRMIDQFLHCNEESKLFDIYIKPLHQQGIKRRQAIFRKMEEMGDITQHLINKFTECGKLREVLLWIENEGVV